MSEIVDTHPYLDGGKDENPQNKVLWNTNAGFPVSSLLEQEQSELTETSRYKNPPARTIKADQSAPETEMLSSFTQWLLALKPATFQGISGSSEKDSRAYPFLRIAVEQQSEESPKKKKKKKKKKEARLKEAKAASHPLPLDKDIISDTLAELIASQGHVDEAILMYRKLVNVHPEKAVFYIQRISELRQGKT